MSKRFTVILKNGKDEAVRRFHPWIFSGAIHKIIGKPVEGDLVDVLDAQNEWIAVGFYGSGSIAVRIIAFDDVEIDAEFWKTKLENAFQARKSCGLINNDQTNAYRLVYGEGDELPGLVIDIYNKTAVIQCHSMGMYGYLNEIAAALDQVEGLQLDCIYNKSSDTIGKQTGLNIDDSFLKGTESEAMILENGHQFEVNWVEGQKTGFFLDQRENRALLAKFANGKKVLNTYCYSGGFSVYALKAGADLVHSVDASQKATDLTVKNIAANGFSSEKHSVYTADVRNFLQDCEMYDVIVLDPPAFAKHYSQKNQAIKGYRNINAAAIQKLNRGGVLFTFSCSQAMDRDLFQSTVVSSAIQAGRQCRILHAMSQGPDHPMNAFFPEGNYLKGLVMLFD